MSVAARPPAFVNDLETCVGCHACAVACANENQLPAGTSWRQIVTYNEPRRAGLPTFHLSLACNHCREAPCLAACPARAIARDVRTGAVLIDANSCIGCRYCSWVCPYDAPRFDLDAGVMRKCTLCNGRLLEGLAPACVSGCPVGALALGDPVAEEPRGVASFPTAGIGPAIRFLPLRARSSSQGASTPARATSGNGTPLAPGHPARAAAAMALGSSKISSRSEWALVAFTYIAQTLVGLVLAVAIAGIPVPPLLVVGAGLVAIVVSTMHLGQPLRAWRALLNVRASWLSREVVSWSAFLGLSAVALITAEGMPAALAWAAAAMGVVCLVCIDRVYAVMARPARTRLDDVSALTAGLYVGAVAAGAIGLALVLALWRITAFQRRVNIAARTRPRVRAAVLPRSILTAAGIGLLAQEAAITAAFGVALILLAELLDRVVFYDTLDIVTPGGQAARDLAARC